MRGDMIKDVAPEDIEDLSFALIEEEFFEQTGLRPESFDRRIFQVIRRVIHASGDFSFARTLVFHDQAISAGIAAIRQGRAIAIDVSMGAAGVNRSLVERFGSRVICRIGDPGIAEEARLSGRTRSETALRRTMPDDPGIIAVGNAPTALLSAMQMIECRELRPALVIGVPVGFVNAAESKALLSRHSYPFITVTGRKGGSPVAVAIINALLRLATTSEEN
jgi:precorrin-8X/cobalt-precorrin-8 methylmutase